MCITLDLEYMNISRFPIWKERLTKFSEYFRNYFLSYRVFENSVNFLKLKNPNFF